MRPTASDLSHAKQLFASRVIFIGTSFPFIGVAFGAGILIGIFVMNLSFDNASHAASNRQSSYLIGPPAGRTSVEGPQS